MSKHLLAEVGIHHRLESCVNEENHANIALVSNYSILIYPCTKIPWLFVYKEAKNISDGYQSPVACMIFMLSGVLCSG